MGLVDQAAVLVVGAEAGVYLIIIGSGIAMIGAEAIVVGRVVLEHWCEPKGGHAEFHEVVEMLAQALQVATMSQTGLGAVVHVGVHAFDLVVGIAAAGEAIGHEHIEHVGIGEALALESWLLALLEFVAHALFLFPILEVKGHHSGLSAFEVEVDEQVVGTVEPHEAVDGDTGIVGGHLGLSDVLAIYHELEAWVLHASKPVGGLNMVDFQSSTHSGGET